MVRTARVSDNDPVADSGGVTVLRDLFSTQGKGPIVTLVDAILFDALARSASNLHLQPTGEHGPVRYRVDGS